MKIYIKKLGCPKNDVDGDMIAAELIRGGHEIVLEESGAEVVVVNTCGFILPAKEESIEEILKYEQLKESGKINRLYITGCLSQRYGDKLINDIEGIDGVFGLGEAASLVAAVNSKIKRVISISDSLIKEISHTSQLPRFIGHDYPYEYIKIADGCNRFCSYCAIPLIRGRYRSRKISGIVEEAKYLAGLGKKEIILVSQEGTGFGRDLEGDESPIRLLEEIERIEGIEWIRLMYLHPEALTNELIDYMTHSEKTLEYFDMPLQHVNDEVLKGMNRPLKRQRIEELIEKIRKASDQNIIRTTLIVGFPGEKDKYFTELLQFISDYRLDLVGAFQYSPEEDTKAVEMPGQVPEEIARERLDLLMTLQQEIAFEKNIALIGKLKQVIIDEIENEQQVRARTRGDCPEIDQSVLVKGSDLKPGDIVKVRITMAEGYDLIAEAGG